MAPVSTEPNPYIESPSGLVVTPSESAASHLLYRQLSKAPLMPTFCKGSYIYLEDGRKILDACGGAAVISIGHGDHRVISALLSQMQTVNYVHSGAWNNSPAEELSSILCISAGMAKCMFTNGGSEAVESAIKLARQYHVEKGDLGRSHFIGRKLSYHGNTLGSIAIGHSLSRKKIYDPMLPTDVFHHVSPCYAYRYKLHDESDEEYVERLGQELEDKIEEVGSEKVAGFIYEPVVGATTGCVPFVPGYIRGMRKACNKYGVLMISDEIMCGMGRTGKTHAWQWDGEGEEARPDIQVVGKGLTGGYAPCAAVMASDKVVKALSDGTGAFNNGFTYQSWTIGARAGVEVQKIVQDEGLTDVCLQRGNYLRSALLRELTDSPYIGDIRGLGLFQGVEFVLDRKSKKTFPKNFPMGFLVGEEMLQRGVSIYPGAKGTADGIDGDHILISPPYNVTEEELDMIASALRLSIEIVVDSFTQGKGRSSATYSV
jgi:adenosylmethionine-8-amino-7-oxononanoate aminotransferase